MTFLPSREEEHTELPFYKDSRYTDLIRKELDNFKTTKNTVRKFIGDNVSSYIVQQEVEEFARSRGIKPENVNIEAKSSPLFEEDDGPGIMLRAEVYPTPEQVNYFAKQTILTLKRRVESMVVQKEQLDKISEQTRNLLLELPYIDL